MKKFTIIITNSNDDKHIVMLDSWELDEEGNKINIRSEKAMDKSITEAIDLASKFIK